jgi:hypothetical protein
MEHIKKMKYLKYFENIDIDPFGEEDWNEKEFHFPFRNPSINGDILLVDYGSPEYTLSSPFLIEEYDEKNYRVMLYNRFVWNLFGSPGFYPIDESTYKVIREDHLQINIFENGRWEKISYSRLPEDIKKKIVLK